jgi:hypothetical protein
MIAAEAQRQILEQDLEKEKFVNWLDQWGNDQQVGLAGCPDCCPIATYLASLGHREVMVDCRVIQADRVEIDFPVWVCNFVGRLDELASNESVTRAMALQFLA